MIDEVYFFDTYAIVDIIKQNPEYEPYTNASVVITKLNLFELYYNLLKDKSEEDADGIIGEYFSCVINFGEEIIRESAKFRLAHKKQDLSMTDCIGYIIAKKLNIKFLTGDKEFQDLPNVEFVK